MAQYRVGNCLAQFGSTTIWGSLTTNWSAVAAGNVFVIVGANVAIGIQSAAQESTAPAYAGGTTYALGAQVLSASILYVSLANGNVGNTPVSSPSSWMATSGWNLTLVAPWGLASIGPTAYGIQRDFTNNWSLPLPQPGDVEIPALVSQGMTKIDAIISGTFTGDVFTITSHAQLDSFPSIGAALNSWVTFVNSVDGVNATNPAKESWQLVASNQPTGIGPNNIPYRRPLDYNSVTNPVSRRQVS